VSGLEGRRVLLTRTQEDSAAWADDLRALGAHPMILPCIECSEIRSSELTHRISTALRTVDWLVFTSRRGVAAFASGGHRLPPAARVAAVGPATAAEAERVLGRVDLTSPAGTARSLADALCARERASHRTPRCVLILAETADDALQGALRACGMHCARFDVYRTTAATPTGTKRRLSALGADIIFLASPSAAQGFANCVELDAPASLVTIGPSTTAAARAAGLKVTAEANEPSLRGLVEATQCRIEPSRRGA
jgi:uroporphyrinogen-III synthase